MANRIWIYQADRFLTNTESQVLSDYMGEFVSKWEAHGVKLNAEFEIVNDLFLILKVDELKQEATGCSIDSSVHAIKLIQEKLGLNFFNRQRVAYEDDNGFNHCSMAEFKELAKNGKVSGDTAVFNNTISVIEDFETSWKTKAATSWHKMLLN